MPVVFISYSHDSEAHRQRVLGLSERLPRRLIEKHGYGRRREELADAEAAVSASK